MTRETWQLIIQGITAFGTLLIAVLAIWGEPIRLWLVGPKLEVSLSSSEGTLNYAGNQRIPTRYYHLRISNRRKVPARNVRVHLTKILKPAADGRWVPQVLSGPLQLTWKFPTTRPQFLTIGPDDCCDIGNLQKGQKFVLTPYVIPHNFVGYLEANERMRIEVVAVSDNAESKPYCVEVAWDGQWSDDTLDMQRHLVVRECRG